MIHHKIRHENKDEDGDKWEQKKKRNNDFEEYKNYFCVCTLYVLIINDTL